MNLNEIKSRINPVYAQLTGTESYERKWLCDKIDYLTQQRDTLLAAADRCYKMLLSEPNTQGALFKAENILREAISEAQDVHCKKCGGVMRPGLAMGQTWHDSGEGTLNPTGPGRVIACLKCETCGWSITA